MNLIRLPIGGCSSPRCGVMPEPAIAKEYGIKGKTKHGADESLKVIALGNADRSLSMRQDWTVLTRHFMIEKSSFGMNIFRRFPEFFNSRTLFNCVAYRRALEKLKTFEHL